MTAREKLRQAIDELSEAEAQETLGYIVKRRGERDALDELLDAAPVDGEPTTPQEEEGVREAEAEIAHGDVFSSEEIKREIG